MGKSKRGYALAGREFGPLLARLRKNRGFSQLQLADRLCQVGGRVTVTRHEVSRWERGDRVPGRIWLDALAIVLQVPLEDLEAARDATRHGLPAVRARQPGPPWLWRPPVAIDLAAALNHGRGYDLRDLAHAWLAGPPEGWDGGGRFAIPGNGSPSSARAPSGSSGEESKPALPDGNGRDILGLWEARLVRLRRADDLLGGVELAGNVERRLREVIPLLRKIGSGNGRNGNALRGRVLRLVAGYAQLAGWVQADAGNQPAARRSYRVGLKAASVARDRELAAHVLGCLSSLSLEAGNPHEALLVARTGFAGVTGSGGRDRTSGARGERGSGSFLLRALLLHRAALAAARTGETREAELMLVEAERLVDQSEPEDEPHWLYWLDEAELEAMTGRCLAVLGKPLRAVRLLTSRSGEGWPRGSALYGCWLARSYVELGETEEAERVVGKVRLEVAGAASARAEGALRYLGVMVAHYREPADDGNRAR